LLSESANAAASTARILVINHMSPNASDTQNDFLNMMRKERSRVHVYLMSGIKLTGTIVSFDQFVVLLAGPSGTQAIYKRAISTVQVATEDRRATPAPNHDSLSHSALDSGSPSVVIRKRRPMGRLGG